MRKRLMICVSTLVAVFSGTSMTFGRAVDQPPSAILKQRDALADRLDALAARLSDEAAGSRLTQWFNWGNWPNGWLNWRNW